MKITQIYCPSCGGSIKGDLSKDSVVCPFCGTQLAIDHEKKEITINKNININQNINQNINKTETKRYIDETENLRIKANIQKDRSDNLTVLILVCILFGFILITFFFA